MHNVFLATAVAAMAVTALDAQPKYPAHWWTPVPEANKPDWEILPQSAKPGEVILSKRHELGILSNFAATPFTLHGKRYASVEGFWQMMLYPEGPDDPREVQHLSPRGSQGESNRPSPARHAREHRDAPDFEGNGSC